MVRGLFGTGMATTLDVLGGLAWLPLAARKLEPVELGSYYFLLLLVRLFEAFWKFGLGPTTVRFIAAAEPQHRVRTAQRMITLLAMLGVAGTVVFLLFGQSVASLVQAVGSRQLRGARMGALIWAGAGMFLGLMLGDAIRNTLGGFQRFRHQAIMMMTGAVLRPSAMMAMVLLGWGALGLAVGNIIGYLGLIVVGCAFLPFRLRLSWPKGQLREIVAFAWPMQAEQVMGYFYSRLQSLLVGGWLGKAALAVFENAYRLPWIMVRGFRPVRSVYLPRVTELWARGRLAEAHSSLLHMLRLMGFLGGVAVLVFWLFGKPIIDLVFSVKYEQSYDLAKILILSVYLNLPVALCSVTVVSAGRPRYAFWINLVYALSAAAFVVPLLLRWRLAGAAWAMVFAAAVAVSMAIWLVSRAMHLSVWRIAWSVGRSAVAVLAMLAVVLVLRDHPVLKSVSAIVVFAVVSLAAGAVRGSDLRKVIGYLRPARSSRQKAEPGEAHC